MPLTREELIEHAEDMRELLEAKRNLIRNSAMGPSHRAHLLVQVTALAARVDQILWQCEAMAPVVSGSHSGTVLEGAGVLPGIHHFAYMIP